MNLGEKQIECLKNVRDGYNTAYKACRVQNSDYKNTNTRFHMLEKWGFLKKKKTTATGIHSAIEFEIDHKVLKEYIKIRMNELETLNKL